MPVDRIGAVKVFQYPTQRKRRADRWNPIIEKPKEPQEKTGLIQGKFPRSIYEWRVAVSLWRWKVVFNYQVVIRGGSLLRGGQILDFLLYLPYPQPLQVFGEYWHRSQMKDIDRFKIAILSQIYKVEPWILWGSELQTQEESDRRIRELI